MDHAYWGEKNPKQTKKEKLRFDSKVITQFRLEWQQHILVSVEKKAVGGETRNVYLCPNKIIYLRAFHGTVFRIVSARMPQVRFRNSGHVCVISVCIWVRCLPPTALKIQMKKNKNIKIKKIHLKKKFYFFHIKNRWLNICWWLHTYWWLFLHWGCHSNTQV